MMAVGAGDRREQVAVRLGKLAGEGAPPALRTREGAPVGRSSRDKTASRRDRAIARAFPVALERIAVLVRVGVSFESAVGRLVLEARPGSNPLCAEFFRYLQDVRLGLGREEALHALAGRCNLGEIHALARALGQAGEAPGAVQEALRSQALLNQHAWLERERERARRLLRWHGFFD